MMYTFNGMQIVGQDWLLYAVIQLVINYVVFRLFKRAKIKTAFHTFLAAFAIGLTAATTSLGPFGLIFGAPAVLIASISIAAILHPKES